MLLIHPVGYYFSKEPELHLESFVIKPIKEDLVSCRHHDDIA